MVVVIQRYFAKPGMARQVIETREEASERLRRLGVPAGSTLVPSRAVPGHPDATWICTYPSLDERERSRTLAESDPIFAAIRAKQSTQLERFERDLLHTLRDTEVVVL